jgi:hypothetical protein
MIKINTIYSHYNKSKMLDNIIKQNKSNFVTLFMSNLTNLIEV